MTILQAPSKKLFEGLACLSCCTPLLDPFAQKYCLHCGGSVLVHQCVCGRPVPHKPDGTLYNHCSSCGKSTKDVDERPKIRLVYNEKQNYKLTCPCLSREPLQEKRPVPNIQFFRQIGASAKKRKKAARPPDTDDAELTYTGDVLQLIPEKQPKLVSGVRIQPSNNSPSTKASDGRDKAIPRRRQGQYGLVGRGRPVFSHEATKFLIDRCVQLLEEREEKRVNGVDHPKFHEVYDCVAHEIGEGFKIWVTGIQVGKKFIKERAKFDDVMTGKNKSGIYNYKDDFTQAYGTYRPNKSYVCAFTQRGKSKRDAFEFVQNAGDMTVVEVLQME